MSCGKDSSIKEETQSQVSIMHVLISICNSQETVCLTLMNISKILAGPLMTEQERMWEKIKMYLRISKIVLESKLILTTSEATTNLDDNEKNELLAKLTGWDEAIGIVRKKMLEYMRKKNELKTPVKEGEANEDEETVSDMTEIRGMTEKERKQIVKSWKDSEMILLQKQQALEDLKAEWDSEKVELDKEIMVCLRGIASLKESP